MKRLSLWPIACMLTTQLGALEYAVPQQPQSVSEESIGDRAVLWVDWGAAGGSRRRDAQLIDEEHESLRMFLHSNEMRAKMLELVRLGQERETELIRASMAAWKREYETREQPTMYPSSQHVLHDEVPLPIWAWGIPLDIRMSTQVLVFDDRDPAQRQWVLAAGRDAERMTFAYCTGWRSARDRDEFWRANPGVTIHPVATDQFSQFYCLTRYPARIRFAAESMEIVQGLGL
jgi:hypothetical protein